jgi:hypothetical protein
MSGKRPGKDPSLITRAIESAMGLDEAALRSYADAKRAAMPNRSAREIAEGLVVMSASKAGVEGLLSGLPGNLFVAAPAAMLDIAYVLRCYAVLTATVGYLADPRYFEDPDWKYDVYAAVAGPALLSQTLREAGIALTKQATKIAIRKYVRKGLLKGLQHLTFKWFAKKVTQRAILTKTIPLVGGVIGGTWNLVEVRLIGARIVKYHFPDT